MLHSGNISRISQDGWDQCLVPKEFGIWNLELCCTSLSLLLLVLLEWVVILGSKVEVHFCFIESSHVEAVVLCQVSTCE
jgi:hypothetical protein